MTSRLIETECTGPPTGRKEFYIRMNDQRSPAVEPFGFFFLRHGETTANSEGVCSGGECDVQLTAHGREQADVAAQALSFANPPPGLIVCGDLGRTRETAAIIQARLGVEVQSRAKLNERLLGDWNGRKSTEVYPLLAAGKSPPGGESGDDFRARVLAAFSDLAPLYARWPTIVSSRGIARVLMEHGRCTSAGSLPNGVILRVVVAQPESFEIARVERVDGLPLAPAGCERTDGVKEG
ncbi:MAG: histidine phosphatase family protein [bacterium]